MASASPIRRAQVSDAEALGACMAAAYATYQARLGGERLPPMDANYREEIENYPCWVVEIDGQLVAGLVMTLDRERASIANIAVDPQYQGLGIGAGLMRFAEARARQAGHREIYLATHALLTENLSLYRHLGYRETRRSGNRVFMARRL
jgi:ribosomal protein S18 acetylase RimI-like enzyme